MSKNTDKPNRNIMMKMTHLKYNQTFHQYTKTVSIIINKLRIIRKLMEFRYKRKNDYFYIFQYFFNI